MGRIWILCLVLGLMLAGASGPASAQSVDAVNARIEAVLGPASRYQTTIEAFQGAVRERRKADVAAFVRYPIRVEVAGKRTTIVSSRQFIANYDRIMTPDIVKAVVDQKYGALFVNDQGVMFGNGEIWLSAICIGRGCHQKIIKVITIQHTGTP